MVERVARAICPVFNGLPDNDYDAGMADHRGKTRDDWRKFARAAIAAMREPTEEMIDAAMATIKEPSPSWRAVKRLALRQQFPVMIDEALKDG